MNTSAVNSAMPIASARNGMTLNLTLARPLTITKTMMAIATPVPRTRKPNSKVAPITRDNSLNANLLIGSLGRVIERATAIAPMTINSPLSTLGKYAAPMFKAVPM